MTKKAWVVGPYRDVWVCIVHAHTRGQAKAKLMSEIGDFTAIRAIREPRMDNKLVTEENLLDAGFPEEYNGDPIDATGYLGFCGCDLCGESWATLSLKAIEGNHPARIKHFAEPLSATEIREAIGVTPDEYAEAMMALDVDLPSEMTLENLAKGEQAKSLTYFMADKSDDELWAIVREVCRKDTPSWRACETLSARYHQARLLANAS